MMLVESESQGCQQGLEDNKEALAERLGAAEAEGGQGAQGQGGHHREAKKARWVRGPEGPRRGASQDHLAKPKRTF